MAAPSKRDGGGGDALRVNMADMLVEMQDQFSIGERLRLAAAIADAAAKDKMPERARLARVRALAIIDSVARDMRKDPT